MKGDNRIMKMSIALMALSIPVAAYSATAHRDPRTREFVDPVRIVATSHGLEGADILSAPKFGQVPEGRFLVGSGVVLSNDEWLVLDFGRELHGSLQIGSGAKGGRGAKVRVRFGESVSESMSELKGAAEGATATNDHAIRDDVVALPWLGRREIGETGFRFVRIDNAGTGPVQLEYVRAVSTMRPMARLGSFRCSDERLNRVFETAVRTVHLCCQDYIWDGIKRDRLVWMGDTHPETKSILAVFGAADIVPATLDYAAATTPPDSAWMNNMATYTLWWIRNLAEWYRFTGDRAYLEKHADYLATTVAHVVATVGDDGLWKDGTFLDWPTQGDKKAAAAGTQGLLAMALDDAAFLLDELKRPVPGLMEARTRVAATKPDPHGVKSAASLLALSGLRDAKEMFAASLGRNEHAGVSTFYGYYMLEAMSAAGETKRALDTVRDYWGGMLDMGATSFWEDFDLAWTNNAFRIDEMRVAEKKDVHGDYGAYCYVGFRHSLCHGWSSGPAPWLPRAVAHRTRSRHPSARCRLQDRRGKARSRRPRMGGRCDGAARRTVGEGQGLKAQGRDSQSRSGCAGRDKGRCARSGFNICRREMRNAYGDET